MWGTKETQIFWAKKKKNTTQNEVLKQMKKIGKWKLTISTNKKETYFVEKEKKW